MRPRGKPPIPSAMSSPREPVDTTSMSRVAIESPRRMTEPLPNCFSIWPSAAERAFLRLSSILSLDEWVGVAAARAAIGGENYFTVPFSGQSRESTGLDQKLGVVIESRYWCFVQYFVNHSGQRSSTS